MSVGYIGTAVEPMHRIQFSDQETGSLQDVALSAEPTFGNNRTGAYYPHPSMMQSSVPWYTGTPRTAAGPLASTVPLTGNLPVLGQNLPSPFELAPDVFYPKRHMVMPGQNVHYQYAQPPIQPVLQRPVSPPMPPQQPQPATQALSEPANKQKTPAQGPSQPESKPAEDPDLGTLMNQPALTADLVREINEMLQSMDENTRHMGSRTLSKVMTQDPNLLSKPEFKPYMEALVLKVLNDPSALVRMPVVFEMEMGNLKNPTPAIIKQLNKLKTKPGMFGMESASVQKILMNYKLEAQQQKNNAANQPKTDPPGQRLDLMSA